MRIVFISDTHTRHDEMRVPVPDGDILIHAGDATMMGRMGEIAAFGAWFRHQPHKHKVFVAGNHDWMFEKNVTLAKSLLNQGLIGENKTSSDVVYLQDNEVTIDGVRIYGSPWQPRFYDWAFNLDRGETIKRKWDMIPEGLDVLITHGPPMGIGDQISPVLGGDHLGCEELMSAVNRAKPKIHVFGHIHGGYGKTQYEDTLFINASICDEKYEAVHEATVIDL